MTDAALLSRGEMQLANTAQKVRLEWGTVMCQCNPSPECCPEFLGQVESTPRKMDLSGEALTITQKSIAEAWPLQSSLGCD